MPKSLCASPLECAHSGVFRLHRIAVRSRAHIPLVPAPTGYQKKPVGLPCSSHDEGESRWSMRSSLSKRKHDQKPRAMNTTTAKENISLTYLVELRSVQRMPAMVQKEQAGSLYREMEHLIDQVPVVRNPVQ